MNDPPALSVIVPDWENLISEVAPYERPKQTSVVNAAVIVPGALGSWLMTFPFYLTTHMNLPDGSVKAAERALTS